MTVSSIKTKHEEFDRVMLDVKNTKVPTKFYRFAHLLEIRSTTNKSYFDVNTYLH